MLLGIAKILTDFVCFYMLPGGISLVLRNKRAERVNRMSAFAQLGLKTALASKSFRDMGASNGRRHIEIADLVSAFGDIDTVSKSQAMMIAQTVLNAADRADESKAIKGRIGFEEYMRLLEGGDELSFNQYIKLVRKTANYEMADADRDKCAPIGSPSRYHRYTHRVPTRAPSSPLPRPCHALATPQARPLAFACGRARALEADSRATRSLQSRRALEAYDAVESGISLDARASQSSGHAPQQKAGDLACFQCKSVFGVPMDARFVACPNCKTTNVIPAEIRQAAAARDQLGLQFNMMGMQQGVQHAQQLLGGITGGVLGGFAGGVFGGNRGAQVPVMTGQMMATPAGKMMAAPPPTSALPKAVPVMPTATAMPSATAQQAQPGSSGSPPTAV